MKRLVASLAVVAAVAASAHGQTRTQEISLEKGWNAVWLEVQPENTALEDVFTGAQVDIVAGFVKPVSSAQFVRNTAVNMQALAGWNVWYAPHRADAPLSRLFRMSADTGYLVHALEPAVVRVRGEVTGRALKWTPNRFNLAGFTVAAEGAPTFRQFFAGSKAHNHNKIYRLANGVWRQVLNPDAEVMRSGEAFWIYSEGASEYQGPLSVRANSPAGLALAGSTAGELVFANAARHPVTFTLELVEGEGNAAPPMAAVIKVALPNVAGLANMPVDFPDGAWTQDFPAMEAGGGLALPLALRVKEMGRGSHNGLLKVATDIGTVVWIPLRAEY